MPLVPVSAITFDEQRQRDEVDPAHAEELAKSIEKIGLLAPIIVDRANHLIAGRHRLEAYRLREWQEIEVKYYEELSDLDRMIVEFDENMKRKALSWQEASRAIDRIHELQLAANPGKGWRIEDTAQSLGVSTTKVAEDLMLARARDNEHVMKRPSRRGALTTLKRERELELLRELARRRALDLGLTSESAATSGGRVIHADCREVLATMQPDSIDLVFMDPPWGIDFDSAAMWTKDWMKSFDDQPVEVQQLMQDVFPLLFRVLKPCCHLYTFFPVQDTSRWLDMLTAAGFWVRTRPLVWFKAGQPGITDIYTSFMPCYETFIFAWKPGPNNIRRLFSTPIPEGGIYPRQPTDIHENAKPVELIERYVEASTTVGEVVLDPFAGGGSTAVATFQTGRYYIAVEKDVVHYTKCVKRLKDLEEQQEADDVND